MDSFPWRRLASLHAYFNMLFFQVDGCRRLLHPGQSGRPEDPLRAQLERQQLGGAIKTYTISHSCLIVAVFSDSRQLLPAQDLRLRGLGGRTETHGLRGDKFERGVHGRRIRV